LLNMRIILCSEHNPTMVSLLARRIGFITLDTVEDIAKRVLYI
jgi:hypothetical protein